MGRRGFVAGAAGVGLFATMGMAKGAYADEVSATGEGAYAPCDVETMDAPDETWEGDVVIIGVGLAGLSAATRAVELGLKPVVVSKGGPVGGCALVASGNMYIALNSAFQTDQGLVADIPAFYDEWMEEMHFHVKGEVLSRYLSNCGAATDWLMGYGMAFECKDGMPAVKGLNGLEYRISQPSVASGNRADTYAAMLDYVVSNGGTFINDTTARALIMDDGATVGVRCVSNESGSTVDVRGGAVLLATGGYGSNAQMITEYYGFPVGCSAPIENMGEGCRMAWAAGAHVPNNIGIMCVHSFDCVQPDGTGMNRVYKEPEADVFRKLAQSADHLRVNRWGKRYSSEDSFWDPAFACNVAVGSKENFFFSILTQTDIDAIVNDPENGIEQSYVDHLKECECLYQADSIEGLADAAGMDPTLFAVEYAEYQRLCEEGQDTRFFKDATFLVPYAEGPYYALRLAPAGFGSCGSLSIDEKMRVLDGEGLPVPGLYSAGTESVGVLFNDAYWAIGCTCSFALTSGYLAAEEMAALLAQ